MIIKSKHPGDITCIFSLSLENQMKSKFNLLFLALLLGIPFRALSLEINKDSLFQVWNNQANPPKDRVIAFYQRFYPITGQEVLDTEVMRWVPSISIVQELALQSGQVNLLPFFKTLEAGGFMLMENIEAGCEASKEAFHLALDQNDLESLTWAYRLLTTFCYQTYSIITKNDLNELDQLIFNKIQKTDDVNEKVPLLNIIALHFYYDNKYPEALSLYQKNIEYAEANNIADSDYAEELLTVGGIHKHLQNFQEAKSYYHKSKKVALEISNPQLEMNVDMNLAELFTLINEIDSAQLYINNVFKEYSNIPECQPCMGRAKTINAQIQNLKGNYSQALTNLLELEYLFNENKQDPYDIGYYYAALATAYLGTMQPNRALEAARKGIALVGKNNAIALLNNTKVLLRAQEALGQYQTALIGYKKYYQLLDSISQIRNSQEVLRKELAFQFVKQRLDDSLQYEQIRHQKELLFQSELNKQRLTKNILIGLGILSAIIAIGLYYRLQFIRRTQTELKLKNEIIEAEKQKAQTSERAKHQFLANMSHEIRTPMNAIKGMTDILIRRTPRKDQHEYLQVIKQSSDSLLVIINDILDISKIEAGKIELSKEPFSIQETINNVLTIMQFKAEEKGLQLKKKLPEEALFVMGDETKLKQILINLIGNAIKFTNTGLITTSVTAQSEDDTVKLHFTVSDTGIGIEEDRLDKIFKTFEQAYSDTSRKFGGTGLGLSISKKLAELHHGSMWVESEKDKGSAFHFIIPYEIAKDQASASQSDFIGSESYVREALRDIRLLLVEDNQFNAMVAKEELEDAIENIKIEVAENGAIAIEKFKLTDYDIILMDVQMPKLNGYEATSKIRAFSNGKSAIPIIAMTANVLKEEVERCYQAGMDDFIGKPFNTDELIQKIFKLTYSKNHEKL